MIEDILYTVFYTLIGLYFLNLSKQGKKLYDERDNYTPYSHANERIMYAWKLLRVMGIGSILLALKLLIDFLIKLFNALF